MDKSENGFGEEIFREELMDGLRKEHFRSKVLKVLPILTMILVVGIILITTVVLEQMARGEDSGADEFLCAAADKSCLESLCPVGMSWEAARGRCCHISGCTDGLGLVVGTYKAKCGKGFLWVSWRGKCLRKS